MTSKEALDELYAGELANLPERDLCELPDTNKRKYLDSLYDTVKNDLDELGRLRNRNLDKVVFSVIVNHKDGEYDFEVPYADISRSEFDEVATCTYYALKVLERNVIQGKPHDDCTPSANSPKNIHNIA